MQLHCPVNNRINRKYLISRYDWRFHYFSATKILLQNSFQNIFKFFFDESLFSARISRSFFWNSKMINICIWNEDLHFCSESQILRILLKSAEQWWNGGYEMCHSFSWKTLSWFWEFIENKGNSVELLQACIFRRKGIQFLPGIIGILASNDHVAESGRLSQDVVISVLPPFPTPSLHMTYSAITTIKINTITCCIFRKFILDTIFN